MGKICLALISKRHDPKKYQVSKRFLVATRKSILERKTSLRHLSYTNPPNKKLNQIFDVTLYIKINQ